MLLVSTAAVAVISDVFVGTLEGVIADVGISATFLGLVIVPIVGNIAENVVAIKIAYQNQMDFSMARVARLVAAGGRWASPRCSCSSRC